MKIKPEHYNVLKQAVLKLVTDHPTLLDQYHDTFENLIRSTDPKRALRVALLYDALRHNTIRIGHARNEGDLPLYDYLDDKHIDTAMKQIMQDLNLSYAGPYND